MLPRSPHLEMLPGIPGQVWGVHPPTPGQGPPPPGAKCGRKGARPRVVEVAELNLVFDSSEDCLGQGVHHVREGDLP